MHKGKTLKSQLLKKLSIKFYETQDLSSTNGKPKLLFYDYSWHIFFLQPITEGNCDICKTNQNIENVGILEDSKIVKLLINQLWISGADGKNGFWKPNDLNKKSWVYKVKKVLDIFTSWTQNEVYITDTVQWLPTLRRRILSLRSGLGAM